MTILKMINDACKMLEINDSNLFDLEIHERTLTHRLAVYLEQLLPYEYKDSNYTVDCEYNRDYFAEKAIHYDDNDNTSSILPDIIIHQRCLKWNLLIIEAKKDSTESTRKNDVRKLIQYTKEYRYKYAIFIDFRLDVKNCDIYLLNQEDWKLEKQ